MTLIKDAHPTGTMDLGNGTTIEAVNVINELNIAMMWVGHPGRTNGSEKAEDADFATPGGARI